MPPTKASACSCGGWTLGLARIRGGDSEKGKRLCQQAAELARRLADGSLLARVALTYGVEIKAAIVDPTLVGLLEEAEAHLPEGERALRARVKARLAAAQQPAEQPQGPIRLAREAIALARELGDRSTLLEVLHDAMGALMEYVPADERLPLNLEQESLAGALGDRIRALRANQRLVFDHLERGELAMMDARIAVCERLGRELPQLRQQWQFPLFRAVRAAFEGRFADAERLAAEAAAVAAQLGVRAGPSLVLHRYAVLRIAERYDEAIALEQELLTEWAGLRVAEDFVATITSATHARSGDTAGAETRFAQIGPTSFVLGHDEPCTMAEVGEICVALGDRAAGGRAVPKLAAAVRAASLRRSVGPVLRWRVRRRAGAAGHHSGAARRWHRTSGGGSRGSRAARRSAGDGAGAGRSRPPPCAPGVVPTTSRAPARCWPPPRSRRRRWRSRQRCGRYGRSNSGWAPPPRACPCPTLPSCLSI